MRDMVAGRRRVYRLARDPLPEVLAWVAPYQERWTDSFERLEQALTDDEQQKRQ